MIADKDFTVRFHISNDVAVVSAWVGDKPPEIDAVITNHHRYCDRHGYTYLHFDSTSLGNVPRLVGNDADVHWIKPQVISKALETHKYVLWTDLDSVFHNPHVSLTDLVQIDKDFVFTGDHNDLCNAGHLFFRKSVWTAGFIATWATLQNRKFPALFTTMQGTDGYVGDQIALNYLLGGGEESQAFVDGHARNILNQTNGWEGNPERAHLDFSENYAPNISANLTRALQLISPKLEQHVGIVVQQRLNAYPWWGPKKKKNRRGPIVHFVSPYKNLLTPYLEKHGFLC